MEIKPLSGSLGAEIIGVQIASLTDSQYNRVESALIEYEVLFFRDQVLAPEDHALFAERFGPPQYHEAYPHVDGYRQLTILENDEANPSKIEMWHADMTFKEVPPRGSILHGVTIPESGGDTMFASMSAAFEALSSNMQAFLCSLTAVHSFEYGFKESLNDSGGRERLKEMVEQNPPVVHPVVRTHPQSGRSGLYVNRLFTERIVELTAAESRELLRYLFDHITTPEFTCRFQWRAGSVAFWDNRITQHKPVNDYWPQRRRMQRITIDDDVRPSLR
ncbi:MAG: taurine dioxygenase [Gammaproteobacteria bacterium TMED50]|nr:MAG: taurine dioxygenase [Gammaproteobacteria bacterium TMED50]